MKVLLLFGGESSEHDVSIMSARNVYAAINTEKYEILLTYIDRKGKWWLLEAWQENLESHDGAEVALLPGEGSIIILGEYRKLNIDVAFPVMHGENGHEDGAIQGMMQFAHIPVVGSGIESSVLCWDKLITKQLLSANGINVTPYIVYRRGEPFPSYKEILSKLGEVVFVKPTTAGSSVGVSKVRNEEDMKVAVELALKNSDTVLIEREVVGHELELAVLGTPPNHRVSGVGEIFTGEEFYSYDDKYSEDSKAQVSLKADISDELRETLRATTLKAYAILGCKGLARVDFLVGNSGEIYLNELNTLPGFTNISMYPKLWQHEGVSYPQLIDQILADALDVKD